MNQLDWSLWFFMTVLLFMQLAYEISKKKTGKQILKKKLKRQKYVSRYVWFNKKKEHATNLIFGFTFLLFHHFVTLISLFIQIL